MTEKTVKQILLFQSLFCWKQFWKILLLYQRLLTCKFQSLFCWKQFWKSSSKSGKFIRTAVSILILLEVVLEAVAEAAGQLGIAKFQSLFCWKQFWKSSYGLSAFIVGKFQSLFCWKQFWKFYCCIVVLQPINVSILILLEVVLEVGCWATSRSEEIAFQSLFCWKQFWKSQAIQSFTFLWGFNPYFAGSSSGRQWV